MSNFTDGIRKTIFSLIHNNGGYYKSEKQGNFLREAAKNFNGSWQWTAATAWGHSALYIATFDDHGIVEVTKQSLTTKKTSVFFARTETHEAWTTEFQQKKLLREEISDLRKYAYLYGDMAADRQCESGTSRFVRKVINASGEMKCELAMAFNPVTDDKDTLRAKVDEINARRDRILFAMGDRAAQYQKIADELWVIIRDYESGKITTPFTFSK